MKESDKKRLKTYGTNKIGEIIKEQNVLVPVERWSSSSIMLSTQYLAAMVYYFVYAEMSPGGERYKQRRSGTVQGSTEQLT